MARSDGVLRVRVSLHNEIAARWRRQLTWLASPITEKLIVRWRYPNEVGGVRSISRGRGSGPDGPRATPYRSAVLAKGLGFGASSFRGLSFRPVPVAVDRWQGLLEPVSARLPVRGRSPGRYHGRGTFCLGQRSPDRALPCRSPHPRALAGRRPTLSNRSKPLEPRKRRSRHAYA